MPQTGIFIFGTGRAAAVRKKFISFVALFLKGKGSFSGKIHAGKKLRK